MSDVIMTQKDMQEMSSIVSTLREKAEKFGKESAEYKSYFEKADTRLAELDKKNEELVKNNTEAAEIIKEAKARIEHLETVVAAATNAKDEDLAKDSNTLMNAIMRKSWDSLAESNPELIAKYFKSSAMALKTNPELPPEVKTFHNLVKGYSEKADAGLLRTDISEFGGVLCPDEFSSELMKQIIEIDPVQRFVRTQTIAGKSLQQPIRQGIPRARWQGETGTTGSSASNYVSVNFTPMRLSNITGITYDMINDSAFNIVDELIMDNRLAMSQAIGEGFVSGDGVEIGMLGWAVDPNVPEVETATSSLTFDDMFQLPGELKQGYNPMYCFNRKTLSYLRTLKDAVNGRYLWSGPFGDAASSTPATINGYSYSSEFISMDDYDVNDGYPVLLADLQRFYKLVRRGDVLLIRDEYSQKQKSIVEFMLSMWITGRVEMKEAGIRLKKKA